MDEIFKALSDPTRREILRLLRGGEKTAGELSGHFDLSKPSMSHHFAALKEAGLVRSRRDGKQIFYTIDTTAIQDAIAWVRDMFGGGTGEG